VLASCPTFLIHLARVFSFPSQVELSRVWHIKMIAFWGWIFLRWCWNRKGSLRRLWGRFRRATISVWTTAIQIRAITQWSWRSFRPSDSTNYLFWRVLVIKGIIRIIFGNVPSLLRGIEIFRWLFQDSQSSTYNSTQPSTTGNARNWQSLQKCHVPWFLRRKQSKNSW
jgi:hypothetical protein